MWDILKSGFFPAWLGVLGQWVSQPEREVKEIVAWFQGWRGYLGVHLGEDSRLAGVLKLGLF